MVFSGSNEMLAVQPFNQKSHTLHQQPAENTRCVNYGFFIRESDHWVWLLCSVIECKENKTLPKVQRSWELKCFWLSNCPKQARNKLVRFPDPLADKSQARILSRNKLTLSFDQITNCEKLFPSCQPSPTCVLKAFLNIISKDNNVNNFALASSTAIVLSHQSEIQHQEWVS